MKKITLFAAAFVAISFASCKKDYTCTCSYTGGGSDVTKMTKVSKKTATANCTSGTSTSDGYAYARTCTLAK